ncbi:hypothetical protein GCM10019017_77990 [Streptomyces showdoensis]
MVERGGAGRRLGVLFMLLVAFAVLVHHEAAPAAATPARGMTHAMPSDASSAEEAKAAMGVCPSPGAGHCSAPVVDPPTVAAKALGEADRTRRVSGPSARPVLGATLGRAPPDLSILSQLRI